MGIHNFIEEMEREREAARAIMGPQLLRGLKKMQGSIRKNKSLSMDARLRQIPEPIIKQGEEIVQQMEKEIKNHLSLLDISGN